VRERERCGPVTDVASVAVVECCSSSMRRRRRRRRRRRKVYSKLTQSTRRAPSATALPRCRRLVPPCYVPEEEEEGLFKADAVNEEDPERDRATQV